MPLHDSLFRRLVVALVIAGAAVTMSCGETPTAVARFGPPAALQIVTGRSQIGAVNEFTDEPLTVQVLDAAGHGLPGLTVTWTVLGGGILFASKVPTVTDSTGLVMAFWQLGPNLGSQTVIAHCGGLDAAFGAVAQLPASQQVTLLGGGGQQDTVGGTLPQPLVIRVVNPTGTPAAGVSVSWRAISRGSTYAPADTKTDAQGQASTSWTLGTIAEIESTAVFIAGFSPRLITAVATPGAVVRIAMTSSTTPLIGVIRDTVWESAYTWDRYNNPTYQFPVVHVADTAVADTSGGYGAYAAIHARHHGTTFVIAQVGALRDSVSLTVLGFSQVSAGGLARTCGISLAGDAYCWGENSQGAVGDGTTIDSRRPVRIAAGLSLQALETGTHTCGLDASGHAFCWGPDPSGELGDGSPNYATELRQVLPVPVAGGHQFTSISVGRSHTCALDASGAAYCWGDNGIGQLGRDTLTNTCYLNAMNRCSNQPILVAGGLNFSQVSASPWEHTCGVTTGGTAYCWGSNGSGQLGTDLASDQCGTPTPYACSRTPIAVKGGIAFTSVSTGDQFTCGVSTSGDGYCWGYGFYGQLGNGAFGNSTVPVKVTGGLSFTEVRAASNYACGLTTGSELYCWGGNQAVPGHVDYPYTFTALSLGSSGGSTRVCAVTTDNDLHC